MPSSRAAWADHIAKAHAKPKPPMDRRTPLPGDTPAMFWARCKAEDDAKASKPRAKKADTRPLEKEIQRAILQWLATQPDLMVERMNTGAFLGEETKTHKRRFVQFGTPGGPDIRVVVPVRVPTCICGGIQRPVHLGIECKRPRAKQSDAQKAWQAKWEAAGNMYRVVTMLDEAIRAVTEARGK